jgi:hypothetical protein
VRHGTFAPILVTLLAGATISAFEPAISPRLVDEAVLIGQNRIEATHARFHQPYRLQVGRAPIDYIDVITPFRRLVLLAEERAQAGSRGFTQREAVAALGDRSTVVELRVEMTFHPLNTFVGVPGFDVVLVPAMPPAGPLMPQETIRIPRFGPRTDTGPLPSPPGSPLNQPTVSQPVTGGTIVAGFPTGTVNGAGVYDVVVSEKDKELARTRVNFRTLR